MEESRKQVQCFFFITSQKLKNSSKSGSSTKPGKIKAYVLLSPRVAESFPNFYQVFMESNVKILDRSQLPAFIKVLQHDQLKVVEFFLTGGQKSKHLRVIVGEGNKALVKSTLPHDYIVRERKSSPSVICSAVDETNLKLVETLLAAKADIYPRSPKGGTLLHLAIDRNSYLLVKALLKHGASNSSLRTEGSTPLHVAVQKGNIKFVKMLLAKGASLDAKRNDGSTCLQIAAAGKHEHIFELLLQSGATLPAKTSDCRKLLKSAVRSDFDRIIGDMFSEGSVSIPQGVDKDRLKNALLLYAVQKRRPVVVKKLLEQGANVNTKGPDKLTALEIAIDIDSSEMVEIVLQHSPDLGETEIKNALSASVLKDNLEGQVAALVTAFTNGEGSLEELFFDADRMRAASETKIPVLNRAAERIKDFRIIDLLVKYGADINMRDKNNETPLTIAVKNHSLQLIEHLRKNGALLDPEDKERTPLEIALEYDYLSVVEYLIHNNAKIGIVCAAHVCPLDDARGKEAVDMLLKTGASYDGIDIDGYSPLHYAAIHGSEWKFEIFLDDGFTNESLLSKIKICDLLSSVIPEPVKNWMDNNKKQLMKTGSFKTLAMMLARHMIKMEAAGLRYGEGNPMPEWYSQEISKEDFWKNCKAEVALMKARKVKGTEVSFYSILIGSTHRLTCYARNNKVQKVSKARKFVKTFPIYASIIERQLQKGVFQKELLEKGKKNFNLVFKKLPKLPDAVVFKILSHLHNQEIMVFLTAVNPVAF